MFIYNEVHMKTLNIESNKIPFLVRVVEQRDSYGLDNCLIHDKKEPLVEFYDARYNHTPFGQFWFESKAGVLEENRNRENSCPWLSEGKPTEPSRMAATISKRVILIAVSIESLRI